MRAVGARPKLLSRYFSGPRRDSVPAVISGQEKLHLSGILWKARSCRGLDIPPRGVVGEVEKWEVLAAEQGAVRDAALALVRYVLPYPFPGISTWACLMTASQVIQRYLAHKKRPPPWKYQGVLCTGLL